MFIINVTNSILSPNTNIIFASILIIVITLSVKRTTTNGITTTRRGHFVVTIFGLGLGHDCSRGYYSRCCSCSRSRSHSCRNTVSKREEF